MPKGEESATQTPKPAAVGLASRNSTDQQFGVKVLVDGVDPVIDLIAVHGLDGHPERTWVAENGISWLREYLPQVVPNARILVYGYDGRTHDSGPTPLSCQKLHDHAIALVTDLTLFRETTKTNERPIIFIAHSVGGIIVKDALIHSSSANKKHLEHHNAIKTSTYGILFFSTPHQGTDILTWTRNFIDAASRKTRNKNQDILKNLEKGSELLQKQLGQYTHISSDFVTKFFYEAYKPSSGKGFVVAQNSAIVPGATDAEVFSINSSHEEMVKYKSADDDGFIKVSSCLRLMVEAAPEKVLENWKRWRRVKAAESNGMRITFQIPFEPEYLRNQSFTGRENLLDKLHEKIGSLRDQSTLVIVVLYGIGGIGKTQIASEYVHAHQKEYQSIFWINAASKETVELGFRIAARRLIMQHARIAYDTKPDYLLIAKNLDMVGAVDENGCISFQEEHTECIIRGVKLWFAKEENRNWLLVFDNVDDLEQLAVGTFIPASNHGKIIMTSRRTECALFGTGLEVTEMLEQEGKDLLLRTTRIDDGPVVGEVAAKLGYLPLAIVQAGAYIAVRKMSLRKYLDIYEKFFSNISREKPPDAVWAYGDRTVWTTWEISFKAIKEEDEEAAELLSLCSFLSNENIQEDMLRRGKQLEEDDIKLGNSLGLLFSYSMARKGLNDSFYIHPVVHLWAGERLAVHERVRKTKEAVLLIAKATKEHALVRNTAEYEYESRIMAHIEITGVNVKKYLKAGLTDTIVIGGISSLASAFSNKGRWKEAEELQLQAKSARQRILGKEHPDTLTAMSNLAGIYLHQGRFKEAEELLLQARGAMQDIADKNQPEMLAVMSNLAMAYLQQGRWKEAEEMQLQIVKARKDSLGDEHPDTILAMTNLAVVYWNQGRWSEAKELQLYAVEARRRILGEGHLDTIGAMDHLAVTYLSQGLWKEAEELQLQVVEARESLLSAEHPATLTAKSNLARIYLNQGRSEEAEELEKLVVVARKSILGEEHPETLRAISNLAVTYWKQGRSKEAEKLKLQVVEASKRILGNEHPDTLEAMANLAVTYSVQKRLKEAEELLLQVVEARKRVLQKDHPATLAAMSNLAGLYSIQGRGEEAEELKLQMAGTRRGRGCKEHRSISVRESQGLPAQVEEQESAAIEEEMLQSAIQMSLHSGSSEENSGEEHPDALIDMNNQIFTYFSQNRWEEAEALGLQLLEARKRTLGNEHPDTLTSMANLAFTYLGQKRWEEAGELGLKVVEARKRILGKDHPDTLLSMTNLGGAYLSLGRLEEAEELALQVVEVRKRTQGNEHPETLGAITNLNTVRGNLRRQNPALAETEAEMLERAIAISLDSANVAKSGDESEKVLDKKGPGILTTMANKAATYWDLGDWESAKRLELQVMKTRKMTLGPEHPKTLLVMTNLAATYWELGRWEEAEELGMQVLEARKRILGIEHLDTLASMANLAFTYLGQKRWEEAGELERQVVEVRKLTQGNEHPDTLVAMMNLADIYTNQGRWKEAEGLQLQVMEVREKNLGKDHPSTLSTMACLGANYWQQRELKKAEELELQVVEGRQRVLGNEHADTLKSMGNLAATYASQDRLKDAEKLQQEVLEVLLRTLGPKHPNTVSAQDLVKLFSHPGFKNQGPEDKNSKDRGSGGQELGDHRSLKMEYSEHASEVKFGELCKCIQSENTEL